MRLISLKKPFYCYVRAEFLHNLESSFNEMVECMVYAVRSKAGKCLMFDVLLENGASFARIPLCALAVNIGDTKMTVGELQLWDCFGDEASIVETALDGMRVDVWVTGRYNKYLSGEHLFIVEWYHDGYSEEPSQHKNGHVIKLDNGNFACMPNNRLRFIDSSFIHPYEEKPDYKILETEFSCEIDVDPKENKFFY